jgi:hypothetical protein
MLPSVLIVAALVTPKAVPSHVAGRSTTPAMRLVDQDKSPVKIIATAIAQADIVGVESPLSRRRLPTPNLKRTYRRAVFWSKERATLLQVVNVLGRWESASEWGTRVEFVEDDDVNPRESTKLQAATRHRAEVAARLGSVERVAFHQNVKKLPFTNDALARSVGLHAADLDAMEVSEDACEVVFDALAQSKTSLLPPEAVDERRAGWITTRGGFDDAAFSRDLAKGQALVVSSLLVLYMAQAAGAVIALRLFADAAHLPNPLASLWTAH